MADTTGARIRAARKQAGLTSTELGARLGLTSTTIERIERGEYEPRRLVLIGVAAVLGVDVATLDAGGVDDSEPT